MSFFREYIQKPLTRSTSWMKVRKEHLKKFNECACCGSKKSLEVHHKVPFHINKSLELERSNLITLCKRCHLFIGHLGHFKSYNIFVKDDANVFRYKIDNRPLVMEKK